MTNHLALAKAIVELLSSLHNDRTRNHARISLVTQLRAYELEVLLTSLVQEAQEIAEEERRRALHGKGPRLRLVDNAQQ